jgi:hypothetical protein
MEAVSKMAFGNGIGFEFAESSDRYPDKLYGAIIVETTESCNGELLGKTIAGPEIIDGGTVIPLLELQKAWEKTLEGVFPRAK